jgi:hypothetical protein
MSQKTWDARDNKSFKCGKRPDTDDDSYAHINQDEQSGRRSIEAMIRTFIVSEVSFMDRARPFKFSGLYHERSCARWPWSHE